MKKARQYGRSGDKEGQSVIEVSKPGSLIPKMMLNAGIHHPNGVILDLEDWVAPDKKHEARLLVRNALRGINFYGAERMVRINRLPWEIEDLAYILVHNVHTILVPKCEGAGQIRELEEAIDRYRKQAPREEVFYLIPEN